MSVDKRTSISQQSAQPLGATRGGRRDALKRLSPEKMNGEKLFMERKLDKSSADMNTMAKVQKVWNR